MVTPIRIRTYLTILVPLESERCLAKNWSVCVVVRILLKIFLLYIGLVLQVLIRALRNRTWVAL